jgi:hypothetical protein
MSGAVDLEPPAVLGLLHRRALGQRVVQGRTLGCLEPLRLPTTGVDEPGRLEVVAEDQVVSVPDVVQVKPEEQLMNAGMGGRHERLLRPPTHFPPRTHAETRALAATVETDGPTD